MSNSIHFMGLTCTQFRRVNSLAPCVDYYRMSRCFVVIIESQITITAHDDLGGFLLNVLLSCIAFIKCFNSSKFNDKEIKNKHSLVNLFFIVYEIVLPIYSLIRLVN